MANNYHSDHNTDIGSKQKFIEIYKAYKEVLHPKPYERNALSDLADIIHGGYG